MSKSFNLTFDYVLYEMSYINLQLYCAALPSYDTKKNNDDERVNADDPSNQEKLRNLFRN